MPMKYRVLEETKPNFEKELEGHEIEGWIPLWETKQTIAVPVNRIDEDHGRIYYQSEICHTIVLQKWEDDPEDKG
ncbi:unnamed protein product [uncultured archaeal virus]|jgi:hypothetical protein|uniref:Uncharacterized protein n=1 Tax=uncultured archaeal virus TaxID=1960247 RepID=A0ABM9HVJ1_9VIRU|nr:unnamed protein product [uncultured archaeal virus]CAI3524017.1 unnamed protein product [uncultured archaeal virus]CAI4043398.1 unnamed protein product [uncultured archaeal virus]